MLFRLSKLPGVIVRRSIEVGARTVGVSRKVVRDIVPALLPDLPA
jgi:hypothetical protein